MLWGIVTKILSSVSILRGTFTSRVTAHTNVYVPASIMIFTTLCMCSGLARAHGGMIHSHRLCTVRAVNIPVEFSIVTLTFINPKKVLSGDLVYPSFFSYERTAKL